MAQSYVIEHFYRFDMDLIQPARSGSGLKLDGIDVESLIVYEGA